MELKFKNQAFQKEAAKAVVDVFAGQLPAQRSYMIDRGTEALQPSLTDASDFTGWGNSKVALSDSAVLENLRKIQQANQIQPSDHLEGHYNLTIEMETGVGKTYTYIKTMYELNKAYGWTKFIIVVPSIAIREGVYKSFQMTKEHFKAEYGREIRCFIYNSARLSELDKFASDNAIHAMIINSQAFNAKGKDARRIYMKLDEFRSRRPIDVIAKTNPILIIDEPQSVEGKQTKENLTNFNPMLTLRYSATHRRDSIYNMVYRLDAIDAYNKHLVKKIAVKGISESGTSAGESFVYLESVNLSKAAPTATIQFDVKGTNGLRKATRVVKEGGNLFTYSNGLEEYKDNYIVSRIDGRDDSVEFVNGVKIHAGEVHGNVTEDQLRRIQIRETIYSHIERERELFRKGIKVLSLFFIDEVAKYRLYDAAGEPQNGPYARMFEEEYNDIINAMEFGSGEEEYQRYLNAIPAGKTHAGYFSIDKKGKMINSKVGRTENTTDDVDAYELIMKNKELLLDRDPQRSPVRFIFSHSALREGWDNPNVFQICALKQSGSEVRKRQEVGRGLRLCVNRDGERMDSEALGNDVHRVNVLTVIAGESYESFAKGLQTEIAEAVADRPRAVSLELFEGRTIKNAEGGTQVIDETVARSIYNAMVKKDYLDDDGALTDAYYADKAAGTLNFGVKVPGFENSIAEIVDTVYQAPKIENSRANNVTLHLNNDKLRMPEFQALWERINAKTVYTVDFDTDELVKNAVRKLDAKLIVPKIRFTVEKGTMNEIKSKEALTDGTAMLHEKSSIYYSESAVNSSVPYDLVGKLVAATSLTRRTIVSILRGIKAETFNQFKINPEEFIIKAGNLINEEKSTAVINHITYHMTEDRYDTDIFTDGTIKGRLGVNAMKAENHLYDYVVYDSENERKFAGELEAHTEEVKVYVKLPSGFFISTPVGRYNPDWAIAYEKGTEKHIYFVAETKGDMSSLQLRPIEKAKTDCAVKHFEVISGDNITYGIVDSYEALLGLVRD